MAQCYWKLCHCPDAQPCAEHTGFFCSTFNGTTVDDLGDVNDTATRDAEIAIVRLSEDSDKIDRLRRDLEAKKRDLEQRKEKIERGVNNPGSFSERLDVAKEIFAARDLLLQLDQEIRQILADLASLNSRVSSAGGLISTYLIVPYSNPTGYCGCYTEKCRQLGPIVTQTNSIRTNELAPAQAQQTAALNQFIGVILPGAFANIGKIITTLTLVGAVAAYVLFSINAAAIVLLIGLIAFAIFLLAIIIAFLDASARIAQARQKIVRFDLQYYRLQNITTCQRAAAPPTGTGAPAIPPTVVDENAWWKVLSEPLPPGD